MLVEPLTEVRVFGKRAPGSAVAWNQEMGNGVSYTIDNCLIMRNEDSPLDTFWKSIAVSDYCGE